MSSSSSIATDESPLDRSGALRIGVRDNREFGLGSEVGVYSRVERVRQDPMRHELAAKNQSRLKSLVAEHSELVNRKFLVGLTAREEGRLASVAWQLDSIEDAEELSGGDRLNQLVEAAEAWASRSEEFLTEYKRLSTRVGPGPRNSRRRRR